MTQATDHIVRHQPAGVPQHIRDFPVPARAKLITASEAAEEAACSEQFIAHAIATGAMPAVVVNGVSVLLDAGEVADWSTGPAFRLAAGAYDRILAARLAKEAAEAAERQTQDAAERAFATFLATDHGPERTLRNEEARRANAKDALLKLVAAHPVLAERAQRVGFAGRLLLGQPQATHSTPNRYGSSESQSAFIAGYGGR